MAVRYFLPIQKCVSGGSFQSHWSSGKMSHGLLSWREHLGRKLAISAVIHLVLWITTPDLSPLIVTHPLSSNTPTTKSQKIRCCLGDPRTKVSVFFTVLPHWMSIFRLRILTRDVRGNCCISAQQRRKCMLPRFYISFKWEFAYFHILSCHDFLYFQSFPVKKRRKNQDPIFM